MKRSSWLIALALLAAIGCFFIAYSNTLADRVKVEQARQQADDRANFKR